MQYLFNRIFHISTTFSRAQKINILMKDKNIENKLPEFINERLNLWQLYQKEFQEELLTKESLPICITLKDGKAIEAYSWKTTPLEIAKRLSNSLADAAIVAKVNNELWDLERPFEQSCTLEILNFESDEGKQVYWHSTAHILGEAMEGMYGGLLCYGPPIENGFYYDMFLGPSQVSKNDFPTLENSMKSIIKEKQPFERLELSKEKLMEMFQYNPFKLRILDEKVTSPSTTVYRCGPLIDLCRGPHVRNTAKIKAIALTKNSSTYWEGNSQAETLQRIYGISFPDTKQLKDWKFQQEEASKRDHRKIGREQELFFFHDLSPGSCFFFPKGAHIYNTLVGFIRDEYKRRGFSEVISPNMYNAKLWQQSGHWQHYAENMFIIDNSADNVAADKLAAAARHMTLKDKDHNTPNGDIDTREVLALKPMNCPGHCLMYRHRPRSWRELPLRYADFGVLHRNELSGALSGLTRVRRFQQDDAHIFCTIDQIEAEIKSCLQFLSDVYAVFGFTFKLFLSTRPEKFMGDPAKWDLAEKQLAKSLDEFGLPWTLNPGDGAFYGPKIDIILFDALKRQHQCATIQLDFQLPERFDLTYESGHHQQQTQSIALEKESGELHPTNHPNSSAGNVAITRPVIIHRAILGSLERMIAILTENYAGKWPFWLSPNQVAVLPVGMNFDKYARQIESLLKEAGFRTSAELDSGETLNKKIRNAQLEQYNFILVVGEKEMTNGTINVRTRDNNVIGEMSLHEFIKGAQHLTHTKSSLNELSHPPTSPPS